ncbi:MAG: class I poly(R)-hydroxyalkanoic acid synthase [Cohaesibacter sp.]|jgi:polyhydroxyalkanoate synthase|nr:class I poly(R)-hydroxyalkanoic acid synthase [Cohaesibacter sp.]
MADKKDKSENDAPQSELNLVQYMVKDPEQFAHNFARVIEEAGKAASAYLNPRDNESRSAQAEQINHIVKTLGKVGEYWTSDPQRAMQAQSRLWGRYMDLWGSSVKTMMGEKQDVVEAPEKGDKRFSDPEWDNNQFFNFVKQFYLITSKWAHEMVDEAQDLDDHTRHQAQFYMDQVINALAPSNYLMTNPELLKETMANDGENLVRGMKMLAEDIAAGDGDLIIRQSSNDQFELGKNIAVTPGKVIAQSDVCQIIQYEATTKEVYKTPLLIVPPWINKFYILDLNEKKSFIKWCVDQGHSVFVISWVNPDASLRDKGFDSYIKEGVIFGLDSVAKATGEKKAHTIGYCVGGTLLSSSLAYMAAKRQSKVASTTLFTTQVDFTHAGDLKVFVDEEQLTEMEGHIKELGYLEGRSMANAFNMLRSNDLIWPYVINNYMKGKEPFPFDLLYWNSDSTRMPAANHVFYMRNCYLENNLAQGKMEIDGVKLDLGKVKVPIYNLATKEDHIAPAVSVFKGSSMFGGKVDFVLSGSGHIAGVVNPPDKEKYQYWRGGKAEGDLESWTASAKETPGSWWPDWNKWIANISDEKVPARKIGDGKLKPIEDAPGSFVAVRSNKSKPAQIEAPAD